MIAPRAAAALALVLTPCLALATGGVGAGSSPPVLHEHVHTPPEQARRTADRDRPRLRVPPQRCARDLEATSPRRQTKPNNMKPKIGPAGRSGKNSAPVGRAIIGEGGRFELGVTLPAMLELGDYRVVASAAGDAEYAAATSE